MLSTQWDGRVSTRALHNINGANIHIPEHTECVHMSDPYHMSVSIDHGKQKNRLRGRTITLKPAVTMETLSPLLPLDAPPYNSMFSSFCSLVMNLTDQARVYTSCQAKPLRNGITNRLAVYTYHMTISTIWHQEISKMISELYL